MADNPSFNLLDAGFLAAVVGLIWDGRVGMLWLGPQCSSFSVAVNRFFAHMMRNIEFLDGLPAFPPHTRQKVKMWNVLVMVAFRLCEIAHNAKVIFVFQ